MEPSDEDLALQLMASGQHCQVFLFNELAVNVAHAQQRFRRPRGMIDRLTSNWQLHPADSDDRQIAGTAIDQIGAGTLASDEWAVLQADEASTWRDIEISYVRNDGSFSTLALFTEDEGRQQEELGIWLVDSLHPAGVMHSPMVYENGQARELTDLLMVYEYGAFLIESKSLAIFSRADLPSSARLSRDVAKHIRKAASQLAGVQQEASGAA